MMILSSMLFTAFAGTVALNVDSMEVNGQRVQALHCDLASGGLFASMAVVGALAEKKADLDSCAPDGAAVRASWTWAAGRTGSVEVSGGTPAQNKCTKAALEQVPAKVEGTCEAVLLMGEVAGADAAAAAMVSAEASSDEASSKESSEQEAQAE